MIIQHLSTQNFNNNYNILSTFVAALPDFNTDNPLVAPIHHYILKKHSCFPSDNVTPRRADPETDLRPNAQKAKTLNTHYFSFLHNFSQTQVKKKQEYACDTSISSHS